MNRVTIFEGQVPLETDLLEAQQFAMIGIGMLARAVLGGNTVVAGFEATATIPASLSINLGAGQIYALETVEASQWSTLGIDTRPLLKQGINLSPQTLTFTAPSTGGYARNVLVQAAFDEDDTGSVLRPYYNADDPDVAFEGPGGDGQNDNTVREQTVVIGTKVGADAPSGSQVTPAPDPGYVGLYVVTITQGTTQLTSNNWTKYSPSPFVPVRLPEIPAAVQDNIWNYAQGTGTANALLASVNPAPTALVAGMQVFIKMPFTNTGGCTFNLNGLGNKSILARDGTPLNAGDLVNQQIVILVYNGAAWQLQSDRSAVAPTVNIADASLWHIGTAVTGTSTAMVTTLAPVPGAASVGLCMRVPIGNLVNGAGATLDFGFGPKPIFNNVSGAAVVGGEMPGAIGYEADFIYDGTNLHLMNPFVQSVPKTILTFGNSGSTSGVSYGSMTWTCPAGVYRVRARVWGAGGGGAGSNGTNGGGGGGGGGYAEGIFAVVPGNTYSLYVGIGGPNGPGNGAGGGGGTSSFGAFCSATGSAGGRVNNAPASYGYGIGGQFNWAAGGATGGSSDVLGGQGGGSYGVPPLGTTAITGQQGVWPGGGGSGGGTNNGNTYAGGNGANGCIILEYGN